MRMKNSNEDEKHKLKMVVWSMVLQSDGYRWYDIEWSYIKTDIYIFKINVRTLLGTEQGHTVVD